MKLKVLFFSRVEQNQAENDFPSRFFTRFLHNDKTGVTFASYTYLRLRHWHKSCPGFSKVACSPPESKSKEGGKATDEEDIARWSNWYNKERRKTNEEKMGGRNNNTTGSNGLVSDRSTGSGSD